MRSIKFTIYNSIIRFIFLAISFMPLFLFAQQAVTKHGENTTSSGTFVNESGELVGYPALTRYGEILPFVCGEPFTDVRDSNIYQTVLIGNQCWMAENLKYLPSVVGAGTYSSTISYYYIYDYHGTNVADAKATVNYQTYGVLYNWTATMNGANGSSSNPSGVQGACPNGWHVPSRPEWFELTNYLEADNYYSCGANYLFIAKSLAYTSLWMNHIESCAIGRMMHTNNKSGFSALPSGFVSSLTFNNLGKETYIWSASDDIGSSEVLMLRYNKPEIAYGNFQDWFGNPVRCVKD